MKNSRDRWAMAALTLMVVAGCPSPGQRLLDARIEMDGQPLMHAIFSVPDNWDREASWKRLDTVAFAVTNDWKPDPADVTPVVLRGKIRVRLMHASTPYAVAEVEQLLFVADADQKGKWKLAPGEVERIAKLLR